jgi:hypothetical protein
VENVAKKGANCRKIALYADCAYLRIGILADILKRYRLVRVESHPEISLPRALGRGQMTRR